MMLARVADSLYWIGRYVERAEHLCRLSDVMLTATLDRTESATQVARIALGAVGDQALRGRVLGCGGFQARHIGRRERGFGHVGQQCRGFHAHGRHNIGEQGAGALPA